MLKQPFIYTTPSSTLSQSLEKVHNVRGAAKERRRGESSLPQLWDIALPPEISISKCFYTSQPWTIQNSD